MKKTLWAVLATGLMMVGLVGVAQALPLTLTLNDPNTALSGYSGPFVDVTINIVDSDTATFKFDAFQSYILIDGNIADLNINAASFFVVNGTAGITFGGGIGFVPANNTPIAYFPNSGVSEFGSFNLQINSKSANSYVDWLQFDVSRSDGGSWSSVYEVLAANANGYFAAAHIKVIGSAGLTGFVADGPSPVPEPAMLLLFGTGVVGLVGVARRRNKK